MFVTEDMTLVAVLKTQGVESTRMEKSNGGVKWVFESEAVQTQIAETLVRYNDDGCLVEPKEYTRKLSLVRKDMYLFLGHEHSPVRR